MQSGFVLTFFFFLKAWKNFLKVFKKALKMNTASYLVARAIHYGLLCLVSRRGVLLHVWWKREFAGEPQIQP